MVEPVSTTLAAVALLAPLFEACERLYRGFELTQAFGDDFVSMQLRLDTLNVQRGQIAHRRLRYVKDHQKIDFEDKNDPVVKMAIRTLAEMKQIFEHCDKLMKRYSDKGI